MNYELKQQLKDAGYEGQFDLESLIEACGGHFQKLVNLGVNGWGAERMRLNDVNQDEWFEGSTPTEAVAKLWLALLASQKGNGHE